MRNLWNEAGIKRKRNSKNFHWHTHTLKHLHMCTIGSDVCRTWWPANWSTASNAEIWEGFCEGIPNIQAPVWWSSVLLKDYLGLQISYLGVRELFQHILIYRVSYWLLMEEKRTDNPVLYHYWPTYYDRWINWQQWKQKFVEFHFLLIRTSLHNFAYFVSCD